jgi:uncharacterized membrane protein HdeD (DUF308 family)
VWAGAPNLRGDGKEVVMLERLSRYWWLLALRGALAVVFGVLALIWPGITVAALVFLYGAYAIVDGAFSLGAGIMNTRETGGQRWWLIFQGVLGIVAGIVAFVWPAITALVLLILIGVWAVFTGVMQIVAAVQLRREIDNEWLLGLGGALSVLFGLIVLFRPGSGALAVVWLIAVYAIAFGVALIGLSFRVRGLSARPRTA